MRDLWTFLILLSVAGCNSGSSIKQMPETPTSGTINISVDESFQPVIAEQLKVFSASFPKANIIAAYKPEAECLRDLQTDSTRMVIVSRGLTEEEILLYKNKFEFKPRFAVLAYDAVAIIVNSANPDTVFSMAQIQEMLSGNGTNKPNVVVDGKSATSTIRYLMDSVLKGTALGKNVTAAKNSEGVVNYVANNEGAIGFVGVSWIGNPQDDRHREYLTKVKMALIECKNCDKDVFAKPSQQTIMFKQYPLVRGLHYILKENSALLGTGLINFMMQERGQLIFRRAYLAPANMHFYKRDTKIKDSK